MFPHDKKTKKCVLRSMAQVRPCAISAQPFILTAVLHKLQLQPPLGDIIFSLDTLANYLHKALSKHIADGRHLTGVHGIASMYTDFEKLLDDEMERTFSKCPTALWLRLNPQQAPLQEFREQFGEMWRPDSSPDDKAHFFNRACEIAIQLALNHPVNLLLREIALTIRELFWTRAMAVLDEVAEIEMASGTWPANRGVEFEDSVDGLDKFIRVELLGTVQLHQFIASVDELEGQELGQLGVDIIHSGKDINDEDLNVISHLLDQSRICEIKNE